MRVLSAALALAAMLAVSGCTSAPSEPTDPIDTPERDTRLALWLAKTDELVAHEEANYDLVFSGWFEPAAATAIRESLPSATLLAGLTLTWILDNPAWRGLLVTVANDGDPDGPLQITDDMYLMFDSDEDGELDTHCSMPGWDNILAMDPRHPDWRELILSFYGVVASQPQHDGVVVDMVDAYPFCEGAWSEGVPESLDADAWVDEQEELLSAVRDTVPSGKRVFANAGRDFPEGSPFPQYLNGYLLENALGDLFGLESVSELLDSAERSVLSTREPHYVVYAVDTDNTGSIDWQRFRMGLAASMLRDNTYFAFDLGPSDHGDVDGWWFADYYGMAIGEPRSAYTAVSGGYRRDFDGGSVVVATDGQVVVSFDDQHRDLVDGSVDTEFTVEQGDARFFLLPDD